MGYVIEKTPWGYSVREVGTWRLMRTSGTYDEAEAWIQAADEGIKEADDERK